MNALPMCSVCHDTNHRSHQCPDLSDALKLGFHKGGGGGGHSHDDDEKVDMPMVLPWAHQRSIKTLNRTNVYRMRDLL